MMFRRLGGVISTLTARTPRTIASFSRWEESELALKWLDGVEDSTARCTVRRVHGSCGVDDKASHSTQLVHNFKTTPAFHWRCKHTWHHSAVNTSWCLLGCSIGEFGLLAAFQAFGVTEASLVTLSLPVVAGLATSVALETTIIKHSNPNMMLQTCFHTAMCMSFLSMVAMEVAMEATDMAVNLCVLGEPSLAIQWWTVPPMLLAGFLAPLPYNYYRLKKYNQACH